MNTKNTITQEIINDYFNGPIMKSAVRAVEGLFDSILFAHVEVGQGIDELCYGESLKRELKERYSIDLPRDCANDYFEKFATTYLSHWFDEDENENPSDMQNSEELTISVTPAINFCKLRTFADEFSIPADTGVETLINLSIARFISDVETIRNLREGKVDLE
jgi:hypothetical protein